MMDTHEIIFYDDDKDKGIVNTHILKQYYSYYKTEPIKLILKAIANQVLIIPEAEGKNK